MSKVKVRIEQKGVHAIKVNHGLLDAATEVYSVEGVYPVKKSGMVELMVCNPTGQPHLLRKDYCFEAVSLTDQEWMPPKDQQDADGEHKVNGLGDGRSQEPEVKHTEGSNIPSSFDKLLKDLKIEGNPLLKKHPKIKKKLKSVLFKYSDVFSSDQCSVGGTDLMEADLRVPPGTRPVMQKRRNFNPALEKDLAEQVDQWVKEGVVSPSESPWSNPLVPVRKKDCLLYTSPSPRDATLSRMPSSA